MNIAFARQLVTLFITVSLTWWLVTEASDEHKTSSPTGPVDYQLNRVEFQSGHPLVGESLEGAARDPSADQVRLLEENASFLRAAPSELGAVVIGSTDNHECIEQECRELSLRRAEIVYKWLVNHGVPASKLDAPKGDGADYPIGDNSTEEGRQYNRRVQLELIPLKPAAPQVHLPAGRAS